MTGKHYTFDAVVVGAGSSGSSAAYHLSRVGFKTALLDVKRLDQAGGRWYVGLPPWVFERAGIALPEPPEMMMKGFRALMTDGQGLSYTVIDPTALWHVDTPLLVQRLQNLAIEKGAETFERTSPVSFEFDGQRPTVLKAVRKGKNNKQEEIRFSAKLFVDAGGLEGPLRNLIPEMATNCPLPDRQDICSARADIREIVDPEGAKAFLARYNINDTDAINILGTSGGFSTLTIQVHLAEKEVTILTGAIADGANKNGPEMLEEFVSENPWIGKTIRSGGALIPIRRPYDRFTGPGIALMGNAACHVFPAHASGVGNGMIAGRLLAEAVCKHLDPGTENATWDYQVAYMRELGAISAAYDVLRRRSQQFNPKEIELLMASQLLNATTSRAALEQKMVDPDQIDGLDMAIKALKNPRMTATLAPNVVRMQAVYALYKNYPAKPKASALKRWAKAVEITSGYPADIR